MIADSRVVRGASHNSNDDHDGGGNEKKKRKSSSRSGNKIRRKKIPKVGDPDYLSPTQLRNRRKRRAKKQQQSNRQESSPKAVRNNEEKEEPKDPSMKYINYPTKAPIIRTAKKYLEQRLSSNNTYNSTFHVYIGPLYHWRTVSKLAVRPDSNYNNKVAIGLFAENSHSLLPVPKCKAHHPSINRVVEVVATACHELDVIPYGATNNNDNEHVSATGSLRYIGINIDRSSGGAQLTLVWNGKKDEEDEQLEKLVKTILSKSSSSSLLKESIHSAGEEPTVKKQRRRGKRDDNNNNLQKDDKKIGSNGSSNSNTVNLHSLWINYNPSWKHSNAIFAYDFSCWRHVAGPPYITEHLRFTSVKSEGQRGVATPSPPSYPIPLCFPPTVFRQANLDSFTNIVGRIRERVMKLDRPPFCVELYGGVGTISLYLSDVVSGLVSSDENPNNCKCFCDSVEQLPEKIQHRLSYKQKNAADMISTESSLFKKTELLILDPPRKGLEEEVVDYLCNEECSLMKLLVYVSCGFQAFQRDCDALLESGRWGLEFAEGHVLFPGSDAIETLAFFVPKK